MKTFNTNTNNDIFLDDLGNISVVESLDAETKIIENVIKTQRGELQLEIEKGVPYFETIFSSSGDVSIWQNFMTDEVESVEGVIRVESFDVKITENTLSYEMNILTDYGNSEIRG